MHNVLGHIGWYKDIMHDYVTYVISQTNLWMFKKLWCFKGLTHKLSLFEDF
jgi:hypothetical protein